MLSLRLFLCRISTNGRINFQKLHHDMQITKTIFTNNNLGMNSCARSYSSEQYTTPNNPDVFGNIGGHKYEELELDEGEKEQENFEMTESKVDRSLRYTPIQYVRMIKDHIEKRDLEAALQVLDIIKTNKDKPSTFMYSLLIRAFSIQGDLKKCLSLYKALKSRFLKPSLATYTSLFNACANSPNREHALESLDRLRQEVVTKKIALNDTHYNAMVKAYGRHGCTLEAFQLVDTMVDEKIRFGESTMNSLLYAAISNKENGLKFSLIVWHLMKLKNIKPTILTYNLLLRAIRDTELGDLKVNDRLLEHVDRTKIARTDKMTPDLLADNPVISDTAIEILNIPTKDCEKPYIKSDEPSQDTNLSLQTSLEYINLNEIHKKNRLILFGGFTGFIERMEKDKVLPDARTITLLLDVVPNSLTIENSLIKTARAKKIALDIDFFNMLIKKRSFRKDYKNAKKVLDEIQLHGLTPDVITWGVLALGCQSADEVHALLDGMDATGHSLNAVIGGSLINNASSNNNIWLVLEVMEILIQNRIRPSEKLFTILDHFQKKMTDIVLCKVKSKLSDNPRFKEKFSKFNMRYARWQEMSGREKKINLPKK